HIGETDNYASFGSSTAGWYGDEEVDLDLTAEARTYHHASMSRDFAAGFTARLGVANVFDEEPPRMSSYTTGAEGSVLGQVAFYAHSDWYGRRYFLAASKAL